MLTLILTIGYVCCYFIASKYDKDLDLSNITDFYILILVIDFLLTTILGGMLFDFLKPC